MGESYSLMKKWFLLDGVLVILLALQIVLNMTVAFSPNTVSLILMFLVLLAVFILILVKTILAFMIAFKKEHNNTDER